MNRRLRGACFVSRPAGYLAARVIPNGRRCFEPSRGQGIEWCRRDSGLKDSRNGQGAKKESNGLGSRKRMEGGRAPSYA